MIRQPIVTIMGHVDHGKTLLLDRIRGSAVAAKEAGGITQAIGASIIPMDTVRKICGKLLDTLKTKLTIPGLLFIDTPGHAAFVNLRKRGGNLADIAILVVNINDGIMAQTIESIEILKSYKIPFIVAANKIDLIEGWQSKKGMVVENISQQSEETKRKFETKLYEIVGKLSEQGFDSDRFDRVADYTKQVAVVPVSAKTGEGILELLMMIVGMAQRYLEQSLDIDASGSAKGTIMEIKEEKGLGTAIDAIVYDGMLSVGDTIVIGGLSEPIVTKVKGLFQPVALAEMREKKTKFSPVKSVAAATGVRIVVPEAEGVLSGMPLISAKDKKEIEAAKTEVQKEVEEVLVESDTEGVIIKADSLGSLEALSRLLREQGIPVKRASIGPVLKKDAIDAEAEAAAEPLNAAILGFNIPMPEEALPEKIVVFTNDVIYRLIEDYRAWREKRKKEIEHAAVSQLASPAKVQLLRGYVFRQSNPAVAGVEVLGGTIKPGASLMNQEGKQIATVKEVQLEQKPIGEGKKGAKVAIAMPEPVVGRQIKEGDILFTVIPEDEFRKFKEFKKLLSDDEKEVLKEIAVIMRKKNSLWGV
jgi:translation initiation factor 5B